MLPVQGGRRVWKGMAAGLAALLAVALGAAPAGAQEAGGCGPRAGAEKQGRLSPHKPNYLIYGDDEIKFYLSLKSRLSGVRKPQWHPLMPEFYVGYSQKSFWEVGQQSKPFKETNYNPEAWFQWGRTETPPGRHWFSSVAFAPYEHESNGRDLTVSRSWNRVYLKTRLVGYRPAEKSGTGLFRAGTIRSFACDDLFSVDVKVWKPYQVADENRDITDYFGYGTIEMAFSSQDDQFRVWYRPGDGRGHAVTLSVVVEDRFFRLIGFHWMVEYFSGYGENLLEYNQRDERIRIGLAFPQ